MANFDEVCAAVVETITSTLFAEFSKIFDKVVTTVCVDNHTAYSVNAVALLD